MSPFEQRVEVGPWFDVGQRLDGIAVKKRHVAALDKHGAPSRSYCIYVHVPFCARLCSFCALYTRAVRHNQDQVFDEYLGFVKQTIATHPFAFRGQPPTTVHFGGGTPLFIGLKRFGDLTRALRHAFGDSQTCEWAVETTTSSIDGDTLAVLKDLAFQRIHLGIQTLDDTIRKRIGRRETGEKTLEKIRLLQENGFLLSVDMIIGFGGSTEAILHDDLCRLYDAGIRMFSICELRNRRPSKADARQRQAEIDRNHAYWRLIWRFMDAHQLIPIHLGQFARSYEDNLYFTHPARGEDCVALGPYAHGSLGRLYYANLLLPHYYEAVRNKTFPVEFGVLYDESIQTIRALESQLLAHRIMPETLADALNVYQDDFLDVLRFWLEHELLTEADDGQALVLSRAGSWFVGNMIIQARYVAEQMHGIADMVL